IFGSWYRDEAARHPDSAPCLYRENEHWFADCVDGRRLLLTELTFDGGPLSADPSEPIKLGERTC
ncbi:MAG: hypothetical protein PVG21_04235, partial [Gammaproteobacteria bacterium]